MSANHSFSWHDLARYSHVWGYLLQWPIYFAVGWAAIYFRRWRKNRQQEMAQSWPSVEGVIVSGKVTPIPKTGRSIAKLQYTYFHEEYHTGEYFHEFANEDDADEFVRKMKDKRVQIRYKQTNPDKSVLEQSVIEQHILLAPRFG